MIQRAIRSAMNETVPMNRLPPGIIAKVLKFRGSDRDLISATHVCRRWRSALTSAPSLWTKIVFRDPNRALAYLTRSGALPIDVSVRTRNFHPGDFYTTRIPWLDRVQSMDLMGGDEEIEAILRELSLPAPLLRILKVDGRYGRTPMPWRAPGSVDFPREFLGGQAPSLRDLSLDSISLAVITKFPLANLTSLTWFDTGSGATVRDLLPVLASAPCLEILALTLQVLSVSTADRKTIVSLHELRKLSWTNYSGAFSLTSCLFTPKLSRLNLYVVPGLETLQPDLDSVLPCDQGHFPLLLEPTKMKYTARSRTHLCQLLSPTTSIDITMRFGVHTPWFLGNAGISFQQIKRMTMKANSPSVEEFPAGLLENMEILELLDCGIDHFKLIQPSFSGRFATLPFPALREVWITFSSEISLDGLAEILERRRRVSHKVKTVRIWGKCDRAINKAVAEIRRSVGKVELQLTHNISCVGLGCLVCMVR